MSAAGGDAAKALLRELRRAVNPVNFVNIERVRSRDWASVTFSGARHEVTVRLGGPDPETEADRLAADLQTADFRLRGHIVADVAVTERVAAAGEVLLSLDVLTVEDG